MNIKKAIFFNILAMLFLSTEILPQEDSIKFKWIPYGKASLNVSQIALSNWSQGGEETISWILKSDFAYNYKGDWSSINRFKIIYGRTKLGEEDFRTNENEIFIENIISKNIGWNVDPYFSNSIRSAHSPVHSYEDSIRVKISDFFDPGYITQSFGFSYAKSKIFSTRFGAALRETFANEFRRHTDDPSTIDVIEAFKLETGLESVTEMNLAIEENLLFNSQLRLFTRFKHIDVWDIRFENSLTAKINSHINVNLDVAVVYEKTQTLRTQIKESLQLGIVYSFF